MNEIARFDTNASLIPLPISEAEQDHLRELWSRRKAAATYRAYNSDWRQFEIWAFGLGLDTLPADPQTVARYLASMAAAKSNATIARRMASISHRHRENSLTDPTKHPIVAGIMEGCRRSNVGKPSNQKGALLTKHLRKGLKGEVSKPAEIRNRAMLLVGYAAALRRSELVAINVEDLHFDEEDRLRLSIPRSKTGQSEAHTVWVLPGGSHCPVRALRDWLRVANIESGAVFRGVDRHGNVKERLSGEAVAYIVKGLARKAGLDPKLFSGHSLRAGHVTQGFLNDCPAPLLMRQGRWRSIETVMRYNREVDAQKHNSSTHLGL